MILLSWVGCINLNELKWIKLRDSDIRCSAKVCLFSDDEDEEAEKNDDCTKPLSSKLDDLQTCNDLVGKHGTSLQKAISELQDLSEFKDNEEELAKRLKTVNEKATLFRITSSAMISVSW